MGYKEENDKKKQYLRRYKRHSYKIEKIEAELEEIRRMKRHPSFSANGMPKGNSKTDLSGYAALLDELERTLQDEGIAQVRTYKDIKGRIDKLQNESERDIMFYRYIKELEFWEIGKRTGYSERHVKRIHGKALAHISIPKIF
jgi:DNA-directed RNA polymerase specialized sigma subunit